ncbi:uncharacterized protein LOC135497618 [Lineus longissimus]|uniref:uncharacterized protein LOC135497618 n=1 Tax=Lineus longissimus TaxID=88925 RepID=UPI00315CBD8B
MVGNLPRCLGPCATIKCGSGEICKMVDNKPKCVDPCANITCPKEMMCVLKEVQCIKAPCYPQPSCVSKPYLGCTVYKDSVCHQNATCVEVRNKTKSVCLCPNGTVGDGKRTIANSGEKHIGCSEPKCPEGQIKVDLQCLSFPKDPQTPDKAEKKCELQGGHLLTLSTDTQWKAMKDELVKAGQTKQVLIGYTDADIEGQFVWVDNTAYDKWAPEEPSTIDSQKKDCVVIDPSKGFEFVTVPCDGKYAYACSRDLNPYRPCPPGWAYDYEKGGEDCYFDKPGNKSFHDSYMTCVQHSGDLIKITSKEDEEKVKAMLTMPEGVKMWIGVRLTTRGRWEWLLAGEWSEATYTNWAKDEPRVGNECAVIDSDMKWYSMHCKSGTAMVKCEKGQNEDESCPEGSQRFGGYCYHSSKNQLGGGEASATCEQRGAKPVTIRNEQEQIFIANYLSSQFTGKDFWIGLTEDNTTDGAYTWSDGTIFGNGSYSSWGSKQPDDNNTGSCVGLDHSDGFNWNDADCAEKKYPLCYYRNQACAAEGECHKKGDCKLGQCRCRDGYAGDGKKLCFDVDECEDEKLNNCHEHANCTNTGGSFKCTCMEGYEGDGVKCKDERICTDDSKCSSKGKCQFNETGGDNKCVCNPGFEGNGIDCKDTNECIPTPVSPLGPCHPSASCENKEGSFECKCKNGFKGDGEVGEEKTGCEKIPMTCDEVRLAKGKPDEKENPKEEDRYTIDPDGTGDLEPVKVKCIMRPDDDIGITVIDHDKENPNNVPPNNDDPQEDKSSLRYIIDILKIFALIENSKYCYQEMWHKCQTGHDFLVNNNTLWKDGKGKLHNSWSGALTEGKCVCGELSACRDPSSHCNCDGTQDGSAEDAGFLTKKKFLPVTEVWSGGIKNGKSTYWKVGPLKCGPKPFDIPKDCHEAKFKLGMKTDRILLIDVDGPNGVTEPVYVNCDMTTYPQTGVTMLPHDNGHGPPSNPNKPKGKTGPGEPQEPTSPDDIPLVYPASPEQIKKLIEISQFCSQYVEFECTNHPITSDTEWYDIDGNKVAHFPGGNAQRQCACGVVGRCEDNKQCDCDIKDGKTRKDFGLLTKSGPLPVGKLKFKKVGKGGAKGKFSVHMLKCGQAQFGIPPTCQEVRKKSDKTYAYLIDPDGRGKVLVPDNTNAPFMVYCKMVKEPPLGITVIGHPDDGTEKGPDPGPQTDTPTYYDATLKQIKGLTKIVAYCKQRITINCKKFKLHEGASQLVSWKDVNDNTKYYFSGTTGNSCEDNKCNCDTRSNSWVSDSGFLMDKDQLPVTKVVVENLAAASAQNGGAKIKYKLEAMECYSLFPTCYHLQQRYPSYDDFKIRDGYYVIDADGPDPVEPFRVYCDFPLTQVKPDPKNAEKVNSKDDEAEAVGDKTKCFDVKYKDATYEQLKALTKVSGFCKQFAVYWGWNAPFTGHMYWENTADGVTWAKQPGWAGSLGAPKCACGPIKSCTNGRDKSCNSDAESGKWESDHGEFIDKSILPVNRFCHNYKDNKKGRWSQHRVYKLECSNKQFHIPESCQELRDWKYWTYGYLRSLNAGFPGKTPWLIDPDTQKSDKLKPFIVLCDFVHNPPIGITIINHNDEDCEDIKSTEVTKTFTYLEATKAQIVGLTKVSTFCTQNVRYECSNDKLALEKDKYGWWDRDNKWVDHWSGNNHGVSCKGADCKCQGTGHHVDGQMVMDKEILPVSKVVAKATSGKRKLCVESLVCYALYRSCHEIRRSNNHWNPLRNNIYAIDPDRAKLRRPFAVTCDFKTDKGYGITIVNHNSNTFKPTKNGIIEITYPATKDISAPHLTIQGLAEISGYCSQELRYKCTKAPLLGKFGTYFSDFAGRYINLWSGADNSGAADTCGCGLFNTCPTPGAKCRCDGLNTSPRSGDGGLVWNRDLMPVKSIHVGGLGSGSKVEILLGPMRCSPRPFNLPKDCQEVLNKGYGTGEHLIWPKKSLQPFLVTCDMDIKAKLGVTIFVPKIKENSIPSHGKVPVVYREATIEQVLALVEISEFCLHPLKYKCRSSNMFANSDKGRFSFKNAKDQERRNFAHGGDGKCGCGKDKRCSGPGSPKDINTRVCNCDSGDNVTRLDAGSFNNKADFPIKEFNFGSGSYDYSLFTLGNLYCARGQFDYDECSEFNDCDQNAKCVNHDPDFDCRCKKGWQGKGTTASATGRQCPDDDECKMAPSPCPQDRANCTNTPGDFICKCHAGYEQTGKSTCVDIDECANKTHNCDENANCVNTIGSFLCRCKQGFRGTGIKGDCEEFGSCACYGDPHCSSFDKKSLHFQGACTYTMVRDRCTEGRIPNYEVAQKSSRRGNIQAPLVSWVKNVIIKIGMAQNYLIWLDEGKSVYINSEEVTLPVTVSDLITVNGVNMSYTIKIEGSEVVVRFANKLEVRWSGTTRVDVIVPKEFKTKTCGLCGNFNNNEADDWTIGPACKDAGKLTTNNNKFGNSWHTDNPTYMPCFSDCDPDPTPDCSGPMRVSAEAKCAILKDPKGKFKVCLDAVPARFGDSFGETYYSACVYDVCRAPNKAELSICEAASTMVEECMRAFYVEVKNWRTKDFCEITCSEGMVYKTCGSPCEIKTCTSANSSKPVCIQLCKEGCFCKPGLVMDGDKCIKPEDCGCTENGRYFSANETFVRPNCSESCICDSKTGKLVCTKINCDKDASCAIKGGKKNCYCDKGFEGDGQDCDDIDECKNSAKPVCDKNAFCNNTYGSYNCTCEKGFEGAGRGAGSCANIDECERKTHNCHKNAECSDTTGSFNCDCKEGYSGNGTNCDNIDECTTGRNRCDKIGTTCRDTDGKYACDCKNGFSSRVDDFECKDDDECTDPIYKNNCHEDADCSNAPPGKFSCKCKEGYIGDGVNCTDKDECEDPKDNSCDPNANCTNSIGSYSCKCIAGYKGDGFTCEDIEECIEQRLTVICNQDTEVAECINTVGSYECECKDGYEGDGVTCVDIDECITLGPTACGDDSECNNTRGTYTCECEDGYASATNDGKNCEDIDECKDPKKSPKCDIRETDNVSHGFCVDNPGDYECKCSPGFIDVKGDGSYCKDIDECTTVPDTCGDENALCKNTPGYFKCTCKEGYRDNGAYCEDIDECAEDIDECDSKADCVDVDGTYVCTCQDGYKSAGNGGRKGDCKEVDECKDNLIGCGPREECIRNGPTDYSCKCKEKFEPRPNGQLGCRKPDLCKNMTNTPCFDVTEFCIPKKGGEFDCGCKDGFKKNPSSNSSNDRCEDENECIEGSHVCHKLADCHNTFGGHSCSCRKGYVGDGQNCKDDNECEKKPAPCKGPKARCINTHGSFKCKCGQGNKLKGDTCEDRDECVEKRHDCRKSAVCNNTENGFQCDCKNPADLKDRDGKGCHPNNDCSEDPTICISSKECVRKNGKMRCECKDGYKPVGITCKDIDECVESGIPPCNGPHQRCVNKIPGFECKCDDGYRRLQNGRCKDIDECKRDKPKACGTNATCKDTEGSYECSCRLGFKLLPDKSCEDIDECRNKKKAGCDDLADCINTIGSHICECREGYSGNGKRCENINECNEKQHKCHEKAVCKDTVGSHICTCIDGFTGNGRHCKDINECDENRIRHNCGKHAKCVNLYGSFKCECEDGFAGHCDQCRDIDECVEGKAKCSTYATCTNYVGGFNCNCKKGLFGDGHNCWDFDECALGIHECGDQSFCENTFGGYICVCNIGYKSVEDSRKGQKCIDFDECSNSLGGCNENAECINTVGSYICQCKVGFSGDGKECNPSNVRNCGDKTCHEMAMCEDGVCKCRTGFTGNGVSCTDVDECKTGMVYCHASADCINTPGSFLCRCRFPFLGNGEICFPFWNPCMGGLACGKAASCKPKQVGRFGKGSVSIPQCLCLDVNKKLDSREFHCIDKNECLDPNYCAVNQECLDYTNGAACVCNPGFESVDGVCTEINACDSKQHLCDPSQECVFRGNGNGYLCECGSGMKENPVTKTCEPVPQCIKDCGEGKTCKIVGPTNEETCVCQTGYTLAHPNGPCVDDDECQTWGARECDLKNAKCANTEGSFKCKCKDGFLLISGMCLLEPCLDGKNACELGERCIPDDTEAKSYRCECKTGYKKENDKCVEDKLPDCNCGPHGVCKTSTEGAALGKCRCDNGFRIDPKAVKDICVDDNECNRPDACHPLAICTNTPGSFTCECLKPNFVGDGVQYCDLNECFYKKDNVCHEKADCINEPGSYKCKCHEGYRGDGITCEPEPDPCLIKNGNCPLNSYCLTKKLKAKCVCNRGYRGDGGSCVDVDECKTKGLLQNKCVPNSKCQNYLGGYMCECMTGYEGNGWEKCDDIDECETGKHTCHARADCSNTVGSHKCTCKEGFKGDGLFCVPDARCKNVGGCGANASCEPKDDGFVCKCDEGFTGDGQTCKDINECANKKDNNCHKNAKCKNKDGGYECDCKPGTAGDGKLVCRDKKECVEPGGKKCGQHAHCVDRFEDRAVCKCNKGAERVGGKGKCLPINECANDSLNECDKENADCEDTTTAYTCKCKDGFRGNGENCNDIDECKEGLANCDKNALCINTPGNYTCKCLKGFLEGKENCTDINECEDPKTNICAEQADCDNKDGYYECTCKDGFVGNGQQCVKPNPCDAKPKPCFKNEECSEEKGKAVCACKEGLEKNSTGKCAPVNECANGTANCDPNADCIDKYFGFECKCKKGFTGNGTKCDDINECDPSTPEGGGGGCDSTGGVCVNTPGGNFCTCDKDLKEGPNSSCEGNPLCDKDNGGCDGNANCTDGQGRSVCVCKEGFDGDGKNCTDINECALKQDECWGTRTCKNKEGGYTCDCKEGFKENTTTKECEDIDECAEKTDDCKGNSTCVNLQGDFACVCMPGFRGEPCEDIDECKEDIHPCSEYATCTNTIGNCTCDCNHGYKGDGIICEEEDECRLPSDCDTKTSFCKVKDGQDICACKAGYKKVGDKCVDKNECVLKKDKCHPKASCKNKEPGYSCTCKEGYKGDGFNCVDVDECKEKKDNCHADAKCKNNDGSFKCKCKRGFTGDGVKKCDNDNECDKLKSPCSPNAKCKDKPGSFTCKCKKGYRGDGKNCTQINECDEGPHDCDVLNGKCKDLPGSFECECNPGFTGDGKRCKDINECDLPDRCPPESKCINGRGSYTCQCNIGYALVGNSCDDIDECEGKPCDSTAKCRNTQGSFKCTCPRGHWKTPSGKCVDINECLKYTPCNGKKCHNTPGSYECVCENGYEQAGIYCVDVDECEDDPCIVGECINQPGGYRCKCPGGFLEVRKKENGVLKSACKDINECIQTGHNPCGNNGTCRNTQGHYRCRCDKGFFFSARQGKCIDIDECRLPEINLRSAKCENGKCTNTIGSYTCDCLSGYTKVDGKCVDIDECKEKPCDLAANCYNTDGSFYCICTENYAGDGRYCEDTNECSVPDTCPNPKGSTCVNEIGGYTCTCNPGYAGDTCDPKDECANVNCTQNAYCISQVMDSYQCRCNPGSIAPSCMDADECKSNIDNCDINAECSNTNPYFKCKCKYGFDGDGRNCKPQCRPSLCKAPKRCVLNDGVPSCVCTCTSKGCMASGEVCGTDEQTYLSYKELVIKSCEAGNRVKVLHEGYCARTCNDIQCPERKECYYDEMKRPGCRCPACNHEDKISGPVCTKRGRTFKSKCAFNYNKCSKGTDDEIAHDGQCTTSGRECKVGEWTRWTPCTITCGKGQQSRTRVITRSGPNCPKLKDIKYCYKDVCNNSPCANHTCPGLEQICDIKRDGTPGCFCPNCTEEADQEVCAKLGSNKMTFTSMCKLRQASCRFQKKIVVKNQGQCKGEQPKSPSSCKTMPRYRPYRMYHNGEKFISMTVFRDGYCDGGCGKELGVCCKPYKPSVQYRKSYFIGTSGKVYYARFGYYYVTRCKCIDTRKPPSKSGAP